MPTFAHDIPTIWIAQRDGDVMYFSGTVVDVHGNPVGALYPKEFKGVAIDPERPAYI